MAAQSHFHHCRRPPPPPLTSYNFTGTAISLSHRKSQNTQFNRVACFLRVSPIRNGSHATRFLLPSTAPAAPPVGRLTGRAGPSAPGLTTLVGLGSIEQTSLQALAMAVVSLLRAGWIAATLLISVAYIPFPKITLFRESLLRLVQRGKIMESSSKKFSVPQKFFCHFYILAVIWTTFLLVANWMYAYKTTTSMASEPLYSSIASYFAGVSHELSLRISHSSVREYRYGIWKSVFLLLLMEVQVLRRLFENIYVFKYSLSARMHIAGYLTGLFFYAAAPLSLCCTYSLEVFKFVANLFAEFVVKGKDIVQVGKFDLWGFVNPLMQLKWYTWIGAAFFFWGWIHQRRCHAILGSLRENNRKADHYAIPHGDWFEHVSSPHYLAEIIIYGGLVVASGFSDITIWLLLGFVAANLTFAAAETHKWYLRKFDDYPRSRCAIIPFVY